MGEISDETGVSKGAPEQGDDLARAKLLRSPDQVLTRLRVGTAAERARVIGSLQGVVDDETTSRVSRALGQIEAAGRETREAARQAAIEAELRQLQEALANPRPPTGQFKISGLPPDLQQMRAELDQLLAA